MCFISDGWKQPPIPMRLSQNLLLEIHTRTESITELAIAPFKVYPCVGRPGYDNFTEGDFRIPVQTLQGRKACYVLRAQSKPLSMLERVW